jgi:hypothetical protein
VYPDRLFLKALVVMVVKRLPRVGTLLAVLAEPTPEVRRLRALLTEGGRFPCRRTWERRLRAAPDTLPAQIGCLGRHLVEVLDPWAAAGRRRRRARLAGPAAPDAVELRPHRRVAASLSLDSWLPRWMRAVVVPTTVSSCRNSLCRFSKVASRRHQT